MSEDMIERVARAIAKGRGLEDGQWPHFVKSARAAIEAMREPTKGIVERIASGDEPTFPLSR